jgi:subtilisin family serine protease
MPRLSSALALALLLFGAASAAAAASSSPQTAPPPRAKKTEAFDPAFEGWWKSPSIAAQDNGIASPRLNLLVDSALQQRRNHLRALALDFSAPRVEGADGPAPPASSSVSSSLTKQPLARSQWNLDRIDARFPPTLNRFYAYNTSRQGEGVTLYVLDSGVYREHDEFLGGDCNDGEDQNNNNNNNNNRCSRAEEGPAFLSEGDGSDNNNNHLSSRDCDGHGTHVASTAIGRRVGVAKKARVVAVRVLDCNGTGTIADVISALNWVAKNARKPAVVTMSLGVPSGEWSRELEDAVRRVVVDAGITAVVASGNSGVDACGIAPARVPEALTVAATDLEGGKFGPAEMGGMVTRRAGPSSSSGVLRDTVYAYSNTGPCVDLFAPGVEILAACGGASRCGQVTPRAMTWATGTSMAVPHIAGAAAIYLGEHPNATPEEVKQALVGTATRGALSGDGVEERIGGGGGGGGGASAGQRGRLSSATGQEEDEQSGVVAWTPDLTLYTSAVAGASAK